MTKLGQVFASVAETITRLHGHGSGKMTEGYALIVEDGSCYGIDNRKELAELVKLGYLREFVGNERVSNRRRNWRYRFMVRPVYYGLTPKGWEIAERYIKATYDNR